MTLNERGTARIKLKTSATGWLSWTPSISNIPGKVRIAGTKNKNCRLIASREALTVLPMVCSIILLMVIHPTRGKVRHCKRSASEPYSITSGSVCRKKVISCSEKIHPAIAATSRMTLESLTQNQNPSLTRLNSLAP